VHRAHDAAAEHEHHQHGEHDGQQAAGGGLHLRLPQAAARVRESGLQVRLLLRRDTVEQRQHRLGARHHLVR
jgi:hypothetical protein